MDGQLSPVYQSGARCPDDGLQPGQRPDNYQVIPFLLDSPAQAWIPHDLCQALGTRGHHSLLCHLEDEDDTTPATLNTLLGEQAEDSEFCLLPTTSAETVRQYRFDHVILLVPANLDAILAAYQRIKHLLQQQMPEIGVVMVGPRDQRAAWHYFRKLALGTLRYLDVPLLNLGFLPERVTSDHGPSDHHRQNFLARISERLLRSEFYTHYPYATEQGF
ncbi:hypothetical protein MNBD_GAMMA13-1717 [hydrothermal vent metagenome]|uniref:Uncharacterized protein n=1 Tax=hydrothermal vent metagenome TaxID=652676 RepID=A0A3B0Z6J7_9ZZZZ